MNEISAIHYRWFCIIGLALIVSSVILLFKESLPAWKIHQRFSKQIQLTRLQAEIDRLSAEPAAEDNLKRLRLVKAQLEQRGTKIQQVVLDSLNRIDRCTSCHIGIEDKRLQDLKAPYKSHSGKYLAWHPVEKFGCTVCHGGQGLATNFMDAAHGDIKHWGKPLISKALLQASCGKCHLDMEVPESSLVSKGREVIEKTGCFGCHKMPLFEGREKPGPSLDKLGSKVNKKWLIKWLSNPRNYLEKPKMPMNNLSMEEIDILSDYLMSSKDEILRSAQNDIGQEEGDAEMGKVRFRESRCISCHSINGKGGTLASELGNIVSKVNREWLFRFIKNPHYFQPESKMPRYGFSDREALDITQYIMEEFSAEEMEGSEEESAPAEPKTLSPELIKKAEGLFIDYGCSGCHDKSEIKAEVKIGPELHHIGSKDLETIDFGNIKDVEPSLQNWIFLKVTNPRIFDEKAKMGDYNLSDEEAVQVTFALLSFTKEEIPHSYTVSYQRKGIFNPQGEVGHLFDIYRCLSCHQVAGNGGTMSTAPLDMEGSQVKRDWLFNYLKVPYAVRVNVVERMLRLWLSDKEAGALTDYICSVFVDDSIPEGLEETLRPEDVEKGRALFDRYGCISCHIVGSGGGYVGPQLNNIGDRLKAGWIFAWLKNPQKYNPKTLQPDYGFSDDEAMALTTFLSSLTKESGEKGGS